MDKRKGAGLDRGEGLEWGEQALVRPTLRIMGMLSSASRQCLAGPGMGPLKLSPQQGLTVPEESHSGFILGHLLSLLCLVTLDYPKSHVYLLLALEQSQSHCRPQCVLSALIAPDRPCSFPALGAQASRTVLGSHSQRWVFCTWSLQQAPSINRLTTALSRTEGSVAGQGSVAMG